MGPEPKDDGEDGFVPEVPDPPPPPTAAPDEEEERRPSKPAARDMDSHDAIIIDRTASYLSGGDLSVVVLM